MQLHNLVNQGLFVLTQLLCQEYLKERCQVLLVEVKVLLVEVNVVLVGVNVMLGGEVVLVEVKEGLVRKIANARGAPFKSGRNASSSQVPPLPTNKRPYNATSFVAATGYKRPATGFGVYSDPATGTQVYNPGTSSERGLYGGINLKSTSPTNIDIDFKPSGLKWNGKDAVTSTQLQQKKANKRKKVDAAKSSSSVRSSKK
ncbi:hypothetical protein P3S67_020982 [Capsicum chacoense]